MLRKMVLALLIIVPLLAAIPADASAQSVANTSQKGSLLIFPKIVTGDCSALDTIVYLSNDSAAVYVKCFWVSDDQSQADFHFLLGGFQPVAISACGSDYGPSFGSNASGQLLCWAVDDGDTKPVRHNHLYGNALIQYTPPASGLPISVPSAVSYNAWSYRALRDPSPADEEGIARLPLDGITYDASPASLVTSYVPGESLPWGRLLQADLALALTRQDLRQDRIPACTKAKFDLWNAGLTKFTGAYQCVNSWFGGLLEQVGDDNSTGFGGTKFTAATLGSLPARFKVAPGDPATKCSATCSGAYQASVPFVGVMLYEAIFPGATPKRVPYAAFALEGVGADTSGLILYEVEGGDDPILE